jgi:hypothetical protein
MNDERIVDQRHQRFTIRVTLAVKMKKPRRDAGALISSIQAYYGAFGVWAAMPFVTAPNVAEI